MYVSKIPKMVLGLVHPSVQACSSRLFVLTTYRPGSSKHKPTVTTFYETGLVTWLYEQLLMSPGLAHMDIRHEMSYPDGLVGAAKRVDLWMRPHNGGNPHLFEAGDFGVGKIHKDIKKMKALNPHGSSWFIAFFRKPEDKPEAPWERIQKSLNRAKGLDSNLVYADKRLVTSFDVYRPNGNHDRFGAAILRAV